MSIINDADIPEYQSNPYFTFRTFEYGEDPQSETMVYDLRYQCYCLERKFLAAENYPDRLEKDEYDPFSTYIAAFSQNGMMIGGMRLVRPPLGKLFPFEAHCKRLFAGRNVPPQRECVEISRLVVSKVYRRRADDNEYGVSSKLVEEGPPVYGGGRRAESNAVVQIDSGRDLSQLSDSERRRGEADRRSLQRTLLLGLFRETYRHCKRNGVYYWYAAMESSLARLMLRIHHAYVPIGEQEDYYGPVSPYILAIPQFEIDLQNGDPSMFEWFQSALDEPNRMQ